MYMYSQTIMSTNLVIADVITPGHKELMTKMPDAIRSHLAIVSELIVA